jgi:DNA-binding NarL/FixJ family response regulator
MSRPRLVLVDDHTILAEGLKSLLEPEFDLIGIFADGRDVLTAAPKLQPDIIVLDISMPSMNGIDAARQLKKLMPAVKVLFLTMHPDVSFVREAFRAGACGYVLKRSAVSELVTAIQEALKGRFYVSPAITKDVVDLLIDPSAAPDKPVRSLTARQREVLQLVAEGRSLKEIASTLNVSVKTVEFHKYRLMHELRLRTTAELTKYAIKHGIVEN